MTCCYKLTKKKYIKKLIKLLDKPREYLEAYEEFLDIYKNNKIKKEKYKDINLDELFDKFLESKGLKKLEEVLTEIDLKDRLLKDKNSLITFNKRLDKLEGLLETLQENLLVVIKENQILKEKLRGTGVLVHKTIRPRSKISSS